MKKLIAISITLALVVSAAFAQVSVGGSAIFAWRFLEGNNTDGSELTTPFNNFENGDSLDRVRGRIEANYVNDTSTLGGMVEVRASDAIASSLARIWWKPIDQLKFTGGHFWGGYNPIGVSNANDAIFKHSFYGRVGNYIPWGWEVLWGAAAEITPIDNFYLAVVVPLNNKGDVGYNGYKTPYYASNATAEDIFKHTQARVGYTFDGIGSVRATFIGGTGRAVSLLNLGTKDQNNPFEASGAADPSRIDLGFALTMIEGLAIDLGAEIPFVASNNGVHSGELALETTSTKVQLPYAFNLRVNYAAGGFSLAGGFAVLAGGKYTAGSTTIKQGIGIGLTLNPTFDVGIVKVGLLGELGAVTEGDYTDQESFNLNIIPYVQKDVGSGSAYLGFRIASTTVKKADDFVTWSIPVGLTLSF